MYELSQIILWILWRLRPVMAVEANLVDILTTGFGLFQDEETLRLMADDPDYCATVTAALADAHTKLDLFVYLRACEIAGLRSRARDFTPNRTTTRSGRTPQGLLVRVPPAGDPFRRPRTPRAEARRAAGQREQTRAPSVCALRAHPPPPRFARRRKTTGAFPPPVRSAGGGGSARLRAETEGALFARADLRSNGNSISMLENQSPRASQPPARSPPP
jgi:hypothetical protein